MTREDRSKENEKDDVTLCQHGVTKLGMVIRFSIFNNITPQLILSQMSHQQYQTLTERKMYPSPMQAFPFVMVVSEPIRNAEGQFENRIIYQSDPSFNLADIVLPEYVYKFHSRATLVFRLFMLLGISEDDFDPDLPTDGDLQMLVGEHTCSAHDILGFRGQYYTRPIHRGGMETGAIAIAVHEIPGVHAKVRLQISGTNIEKMDWLVGRAEPFLVIRKSSEDGSEFTEVARTEPVKMSISPQWQPIEIDMFHLCDGDDQRRLRFECYDFDPSGESELIGSFTTTFGQLRDKRSSSFELSGNAAKQRMPTYINCGLINIDKVEVIEQYSFVDLLRSGFELNLMAAIDFTSSNGALDSGESRHKLHQTEPNDYLKTIFALHYGIPSFNTTKFLYPYGFGAKIKPNNEISHCFPLSSDKQNPHVLGIKGVSDIYQMTLQDIEFHGPTIISKVIATAASLAKTLSLDKQYLTLFILLDGEIDDLRDTIREIVNISTLPVSIVFVGIGDCEFSSLELLEQKKHLLQHRGLYAERNVVKFVRFNDHYIGDDGEARLMEAMLSHLPSQILEYTLSRGIKPKISSTHQSAALPPISGYPSASVPHGMAPAMYSDQYMGRPLSQDSSTGAYPPYGSGLQVNGPSVTTSQPPQRSSPSPPSLMPMFNQGHPQGFVNPSGFMQQGYPPTYSMSPSPSPPLMPPPPSSHPYQYDGSAPVHGIDSGLFTSHLLQMPPSYGQYQQQQHRSIREDASVDGNDDESNEGSETGYYHPGQYHPSYPMHYHFQQQQQQPQSQPPAPRYHPQAYPQHHAGYFDKMTHE